MNQEGLEFDYQIKGVKFLPYSSEEKKNLRLKEITNPCSFDVLNNPNSGGLHDPALGCYKVGQRCETCGLHFAGIQGAKALTCPGHLSTIKLPLPVFNPMIFQSMIKLLKSMCFRCEKLVRRRSECYLFMKQIDALNLGALDMVTKMAHIHRLLQSEYSATIDDAMFHTFKAELDKCLGLASESVGSVDMDKMATKHIEALKEECCDNFFVTKRCKCPECHAELPILKHRQGATIHVSHPRVKASMETRNVLTPVDARKILRKLWDNDACVLKRLFPCFEGCPETIDAGKGVVEYPTDIFFLDSVFAMALRSRPPTHMNNMITEHPLSIALKYILDSANNLRSLIVDQADGKKKEITPETIHYHWFTLQMRVNGYIDRSLAKLFKDAPSGIKQVLEKKEGLLRWNIMGKRVNHAARSVISPDPNIACNEVGIPIDIAKKLFYTEYVTPRNFEDIRKAVIIGPTGYPGSVSIQMENGSVVSLHDKNAMQREALANQLLTPMVTGQKCMNFKRVRRHLKHGDALILNRQPTLHRPSMQCFRARVLEDARTIRMTYSACKAFNADFDGDEMNAHFPQDEVARAEALHIVTANEQYLVPKDGKPIAGLIQDHIVSGVLLTVRGRFFNKQNYQEMVYAALGTHRHKMKLLPPSVVKPILLWSGKEVISTVILNVIPEGKSPLSMEGSSKVSNEDFKVGSSIKKALSKRMGRAFSKMSETEVVVIDGELVSGIMDKSQYGSADNGLVHWCYELYGGEVASKMLTCFAKLFSYFLYSQHSFTMGVADIIITCEGNMKREEKLNEVLDLGDGVMAQALSNKINPEEEDGVLNCYKRIVYSSEPSDMTELDQSVKGKMIGFQDQIKKSCWPHDLYKSFPWNSLLLMVISGAKGAVVNCMQISCLLGQVDLEGRRPPVMSSGTTIALFKPLDLRPRAGGFIFDRFYTGIEPPEFYFHSMAGRDGLIDTTVKTSRSGYLQRCLVKHMEGLKVAYDETVRDHDGSIIQFKYGGDGLDVMKTALLSKKHFTHLVVNRDAVMNKARLGEVLSKVDSKTAESLHQQIEDWKERNQENNTKSAFEFFCKRNWEKAWEKFAHLEDLSIWKRKSMCSKKLSEMFEELSEKHKLKYAKKLESCPDPVPSVLKVSNHLGCTGESFHKEMDAYIKGEFNKATLIKKESNKKIKEDDIKNLLNYKYQTALIAPGEAVGVLAATSMGEQTTQMTLNTFHYAGHSAMNVTLGVPRLREILMTASKVIKTPQITVPLRRIDPEMEGEVEKLIRKFVRVPLDEVVKQTYVEVKRPYDPNGKMFLEYKIRFELEKASKYRKEYDMSSEKILRYLEKHFFQDVIRRMKVHLKSLDLLQDLRCEKVKSENKQQPNEDGKEVKEGNDGDDGDDGGPEEDEGKVEDDEEDDDDKEIDEVDYGDEDESNDDDDDDDDDEDGNIDEFETKEKKSKDEDDDEEENGEKENEEKANEEENDIVDDYGKEVRKRKVKKNNGETIIEEEDETGRSAKRKKSGADPQRVKDVLNQKHISSYEYDSERNLWCVVGFVLPAAKREMNVSCLVDQEIKKAQISQVPGIKSCVITDIEVNNSPAFIYKSAMKLQEQCGVGHGVRRKKLILQGTNLMELYKYEDKLCLEEIYTNDIHAMANHYSIEVATQVLIDEIRQVFKVYNIELDYRHLSLIADYMTFEGSIKPFSRHGLQSSTSVMQKATFESTLNFLKSAIIHGAYDNLECPSSRITVGRPIKTGTGCFDLKVPINT